MLARRVRELPPYLEVWLEYFHSYLPTVVVQAHSLSYSLGWAVAPARGQARVMETAASCLPDDVYHLPSFLTALADSLLVQAWAASADFENRANLAVATGDSVAVLSCAPSSGANDVPWPLRQYRRESRLLPHS